MYAATTRNIRVSVMPEYLGDQSRPQEGYYAWAYAIRIENQGERAVQLLNRRWHITDANGHVQEVEGPGVVGKQPVLGPGEAFAYTSGVPLTTPSGLMAGAYEMVECDSGRRFEIAVPAFSLDSPDQARRPN